MASLRLRCPSCGGAATEADERCPACRADLSVALLLPEHQGWDSTGEVLPSGRVPRTLRKVAVSVALLVLVWGALSLAGSRTPVRDVPAASSRPSPEPPAMATEGRPPIAANGLFICPSGATLAGYPSGFYYPPNHPGRPALSQRPVRCYPTAIQAEGNGDSLGRLAPPYRQTGMVFLGPPGPQALRGCRGAARELGFAVPCPGLLPLPAFGIPAFGCPNRDVLAPRCVFRDTASDAAAFVFVATDFGVPPGWQPDPVPDLLVVARPLGAGGSLADPAGAFGCTPQGGSSSASIALPTAAVHDRPAVFVPCRAVEAPGGVEFATYAGRSVLQWRERGLLCEVSISGGDPDLVRALDWWVAAQTRWVGPRGPEKP